MRVNEPACELPVRPCLGVLFPAALSAWLSALFVEQLTWMQFAEGGTRTTDPICFIIILIVVIAFVVLRISRLRISMRSIASSGFAVGVVAFVSIAFCGNFYWQGWVVNVDIAEEEFASGQPIYLELVGDPVQRDYGTVSNCRLKVQERSMELRMIWPDSDDAQILNAGHAVRVQGSFSTPKADEGGRWNHQNGFVGMVKATHVEACELEWGLRALVAPFRDVSLEHIERRAGDGAGLLAGVLLGNRSLYAGSELEQAFKTTGLAHLMAVSGTHLAVVTMLISVILKILRMSRLPRNILTLLMLVFYVVLTCFAPSAIRACAMCAIALLFGGMKRRKHILSGLFLCAFVFIGLSPNMAFSLGFGLSVLAVCGLVIFEPLVEVWVLNLLPDRLEKLASAVAMTLAATMTTMPVTISSFAQLPLISPAANLIAAPLISTILGTGLLALLIYPVVPPVGDIFLQVSAACANLCVYVVEMLADIPFACVPLSASSVFLAFVFAVFLVVIWVIWPLPGMHEARSRIPVSFGRRIQSRSFAVGALVLPLALVLALGFGSLVLPFASNASRVVMLDVGQGDCMLIESEGHSILVDTGEKGDVLQRGLARQGITHLDAVIITHKDVDHCGALRSLAGVVGVDNVFIHADLLDKDFEQEVIESARWVTGGDGARGLRPGDKLVVGEFSLTLLAPQRGGESENEDSLVNLLEYDAGCNGSIEERGLLTGDAESEALESAIPKVGRIEIFKVPHHGSEGGVSKEQLAVLHPAVALIGVGEKNRYGHPNPDTLRLLESSGAKTYRTDLQGDVMLSFSATGIGVTTQK